MHSRIPRSFARLLPYPGLPGSKRPAVVAVKGLMTLFLFLLLNGPVQASIMDIFSVIQPPAERKPGQSVEFIEGDEESEAEILLITLRGVIADREEGDSPLPLDLKGSMLEKIRKDIEVAIAREQIKGVLLEIDSPGGEVTASDILHHRLQQIKDQKKPMVALIGALGASGAYYVACAADKIMAHPTSIVGSIGAIMQTFNIEELVQQLGIKHVVFKSERTPKKDLLSPFRTISDEEQAMLLSIVNSIYDRFVEIVAKARNKTTEEVIKLADGGLFTSHQALASGLLDAVGYRDDALKELKKILNLESIKLVKRKERRGIGEILREVTSMQIPAVGFPEIARYLLNMEATPSLRYQLHLPVNGK